MAVDDARPLTLSEAVEALNAAREAEKAHYLARWCQPMHDDGAHERAFDAGWRAAVGRMLGMEPGRREP